MNQTGDISSEASNQAKWNKLTKDQKTKLLDESAQFFQDIHDGQPGDIEMNAVIRRASGGHMPAEENLEDMQDILDKLKEKYSFIVDDNDGPNRIDGELLE